MFKKLLVLCSVAISLFASPKAIIHTNQGDIEVELRPDVAPKAVENFTKLSKSNYYDGIIFHRVIKNFMIQTGDPTGTGTGGGSIWGKPFEDEITPKLTFDKPYMLAMANRGYNTNGSQFFITVAPTPWLNGKHTIFGTVTKGQDIVKKIENTPTGPNDKPIQKQYIIGIEILDQ